jgi:hypothetical protein
MVANGSYRFPSGGKGEAGEYAPVPGKEAMTRQRSEWFPIVETLDLRQRPIKGAADTHGPVAST